MKVNWLVEDGPWSSDQTDTIVNEIVKQGHSVEVIKYKPFGATVLDQFSDNSCTIAVGSINLIRQVQQTKRWYPGAFSNWDNFKCSTYYSYYGKYLLNYEYLMMPLAELSRRWTELQYHFGKEELFVRPDNGTKGFTGQTSIDGKFKDFGKPETLCVVASAKRVSREYRVFCDKNGPFAGSMYRNADGNIEYFDIYKDQYDENCFSNQVIEYCKQICKEVEWTPDKLFALDIGAIQDNDNDIYDWGLLELTAYSCAGWYSANIADMIRYGVEAAIEDYREVFEGN